MWQLRIHLTNLYFKWAYESYLHKDFALDTSNLCPKNIIIFSVEWNPSE